MATTQSPYVQLEDAITDELAALEEYTCAIHEVLADPDSLFASEYRERSRLALHDAKMKTAQALSLNIATDIAKAFTQGLKQT